MVVPIRKPDSSLVETTVLLRNPAAISRVRADNQPGLVVGALIGLYVAYVPMYAVSDIVLVSLA
jgi:hypothetical protein